MPSIGSWDEFTLERFILERMPQWLPDAIVTSLPTNPRDGQEVNYLADATNGYVWHLKYRAKSASAYKWEFLGGTPLYASVETGEASASTVYVDLATVGPSIAIPREGDYLYDWGCFAVPDTAGASAFMSPNSSDASVTQVTAGAGNTGVSAGRSLRFTAVTVGTKTMKYRVTSGNGSWYYRWFKATPIRIG